MTDRSPEILHRDVLDAVASSLGSEVMAAHALQIEPTGTGFTHGYRVSLRDSAGALADHTVFVETSPPDATRPGVLRRSGRGSVGALGSVLRASLGR